MDKTFDILDDMENLCLVLDMDRDDRLICLHCNRPFRRLANLTNHHQPAEAAGKIIQDISTPYFKHIIRQTLKERKPAFAILHSSLNGLELCWRVYCQPLRKHRQILAICFICQAYDTFYGESNSEKAGLLYEELFQSAELPMALLQMQADHQLDLLHGNKKFYKNEAVYDQCFQQSGFQEAALQALNQGSNVELICPIKSPPPVRVSAASPIESGTDDHFFVTLQISALNNGLPDMLFFVQVLACTENSQSYKNLSLQIKPWEKEVLDLVIMGYPTKNIALLLGVTESTIKKRLTSCYRKIGVSSRSELLVACLTPIAKES